jgi:hypothetical protein
LDDAAQPVMQSSRSPRGSFIALVPVAPIGRLDPGPPPQIENRNPAKMLYAWNNSAEFLRYNLLILLVDDWPPHSDRNYLIPLIKKIALRDDAPNEAPILIWNHDQRFGSLNTEE